MRLYSRRTCDFDYPLLDYYSTIWTGLERGHTLPHLLAPLALSPTGSAFIPTKILSGRLFPFSLALRRLHPPTE